MLPVTRQPEVHPRRKNFMVDRENLPVEPFRSSVVILAGCRLRLPEEFLRGNTLAVHASGGKSKRNQQRGVSNSRTRHELRVGRRTVFTGWHNWNSPNQLERQLYLPVVGRRVPDRAEDGS